MHILKVYFLITILIICQSSLAGDPARDIQFDRQFFFDHYIVESIKNVTQKVHKPEKLGFPLIQRDKPWERVTYFTCNAYNVIWDPKDKLYKCLYEDWHFDPVEHARTGASIVSKTQFARYLYAESSDGIHWHKPELGLVYENGHNTNIVMGGDEWGSVHAAYVFLDSLETDPKKRFKVIYYHEGHKDVRLGSSPDGIHWRQWKEKPTFGGESKLGDVITIALDMENKKYIANTRSKNMNRGMGSRGRTGPYEGLSLRMLPVFPDHRTKRRVYQTESTDFLNWAPIRPLLYADHSVDNLDDAFYGMVQYNSGGFWIGFLNVLKMAENTMHLQLVYSRDGRHFHRMRPGQVWMNHGKPGTWDQYMVTLPNPPIQVNDELYLFHGGSKNHHDMWISGLREGLEIPEVTDFSNVGYALGLAKIKKDRFVSLSALDIRPGVIVTKPFKTSGNKLVINAKCHQDGYIRIQVADENDNVLPGYERDNCISFTGDAVSHLVKWKDKSSIPSYKTLKLHIYLFNADLFTFEFE